MKRSVIFTDLLGPGIFLVLRVKGQVLHRERGENLKKVAYVFVAFE